MIGRAGGGWVVSAVLAASVLSGAATAAEVGPLRPTKTSVKLFDVASLHCAGIGTVLVNDVLSCKVGADERPNCIDLVAVASRAKIALTK